MSYSGLLAGLHTFMVTVTDDAGNKGSAIFSWAIDLTVPTALILTTPLNPTNSNAPSFTFSSNEDSTFSCQLEKGDVVIDASACESDPLDPWRKGSKGYSGLGEGEYTFTVTARDRANNPSSASFSWVIDVTAPVVTIDSVSPNPTSGGSTVRWHAGESGSFSVRIGGTNCSDGVEVASGSYTTLDSVTSPVAAGSLAEGTNTIRVCVRDAATNTVAPSCWLRPL